jgi:hypothetical protein
VPCALQMPIVHLRTFARVPLSFVFLLVKANIFGVDQGSMLREAQAGKLRQLQTFESFSSFFCLFYFRSI